MKFIPLLLVLVIGALLVLVIGAAAQLTINTPFPDPAECASLLLSWGGGTPPYFLQTGTQLTWKVNQAVGTVLILAVKDDTGQTSNSASFTVASGSSNPGKSSSSTRPSTPTSHSTPTDPSTPIATDHSASATGPSSSAGASSSNGGSSTVATSSSAPLSNTGSPSSPTSSPSDPGPPAAATKKKKVAGPIAGGVIGGLMVLGALGFFLWRFRRQGQSPGGPAFAGGLDDMEKEPSAQPLPATSGPTTAQNTWSPEDLFTTLPSSETQLSPLPSQVVPPGILAGEEKARQYAGGPCRALFSKKFRELQELADASSVSSTSQTTSSNAELLDEIRRLREQMHAIEQRIQIQSSAEQATTGEPPEYTKT
ncbi:hypothetical protein B0H14DRAFT_3421724 [Mycena olivaceomarginata]|nr:hypothetical protein B0H14DRAFT_3421724 [Mycena olivaceomarginata]